MSGCVFWNHVNNFYTNILHAVYIYNHTSHVGRWRKIFSLQCLYSKLLFLRVAGDQNCSGQFSISASFGVWCLYKHPAVPDTQRLPPCTRSSLCLHMWHTANLLPAFCFFSVFTVYQRDSPRASCFPQCTVAFIRARRRKRGARMRSHARTIQSAISLVLPWPCFIGNLEVKLRNFFVCCSHANAALWLKFICCSVRSTWEHNLPRMKT